MQTITSVPALPSPVLGKNTRAGHSGQALVPRQGKINWMDLAGCNGRQNTGVAALWALVSWGTAEGFTETDTDSLKRHPNMAESGHGGQALTPRQGNIN